MERIRLWQVCEVDGRVIAKALPDVSSTDTERMFEDLLVRSSDVLMEKVNLVGRQVPTSGGSLDLLGVDVNGRVIVFELKRGMLTREAVAQVVDYTSHVAELDDREFAAMVEKHSGRNGIERIDDFLDWYTQEHPNQAGILDEHPKMVLVGLGADDRARRMVSFLARSGVDIELISFHAFSAEGKLLLAREAEGPRIRRHSDSERLTREEKFRFLQDAAEGLGVKDFLEQVAAFVESQMPGCSRNAGTTSLTFYLPERTSEDQPTQRSYATLYLGREQGQLRLVFPRRATDAAGGAVQVFRNAVPDAEPGDNQYSALTIKLDRASWNTTAPPLKGLFEAVLVGRG